ncbi:hypothetical protein CNMCM6936_000037 [Aspergillus lentulus]|uniref:Uncharacterized protein n=1 Tax=Aspergillus lentulus TaxID=293939 RepID=A0AAN5YJH3_ASPLE|nr:hypothetical protein CNMCM6069_004605 [Aspergillus lentulus]KAF4164000.1 hypothetical protein CNMCM6936_000037 [Aspergillus lentulus]KAF4173520.1 hypothetical protein CNMCM8060_000034 [Aspergillus lentulus]KAF4181059.1 hypothetical protein CNMCM7927_000804 [Aspergillus lentulus]KAF4192445.1 hypothetical protein CNMCM8694_000308 [Aspergillus lentulus]
MPLRILEGEPPSPPAWGTLPLDIYLLSEWDTSHSSYLTEASQHPVPESPSGRRSRLIHKFLALGSAGHKEEAHKFLWSQNLDAAFVWPDGIIFDDKELFGGEEINLARFLETFPERVTNVGSESEEDKNPLLQYGDYHAACVVTHMFNEDEEALDGNGLLHVFLDDTANVVRHWRTDDEGRDYGFDGTWKEGNWKEDLVSGKGELGAAYCEGGVRGPAL